MQVTTAAMRAATARFSFMSHDRSVKLQFRHTSTLCVRPALGAPLGRSAEVVAAGWAMACESHFSATKIEVNRSSGWYAKNRRREPCGDHCRHHFSERVVRMEPLEDSR